MSVDVIELSSESEVDSEGNDCMMVPGKEDDIDDGEEAEVEDVNDGGAHINDEYNLPDEKGRVLVNVGHPAEDPDIFLSPQMARMIKPHQVRWLSYPLLFHSNLVSFPVYGVVISTPLSQQCGFFSSVWGGHIHSSLTAIWFIFLCMGWSYPLHLHSNLVYFPVYGVVISTPLSQQSGFFSSVWGGHIHSTFTAIWFFSLYDGWSYPLLFHSTSYAK